MKKLITTALLITLIALYAFTAQETIEATESTEVEWTVAPWLVITIELPVYGFGEIDPGADTAEAPDANSITIDTNADWAITYEVDAELSDYLQVDLSEMSGTGPAEVSISYTLLDLRYMSPGLYNLVVTFTVAVG
ncbi:unnamed protein product [marine sediment metagenome]|uniref:Uncharacterized protein n=1 Tax=marine sediment metagenome TaxID=412755 RepID=X0V0S8_9ZZZZ